MTGKPIVSVIIPTYNRAHLISGAIQSVLDQTYQDFELIVVDDGSKDNTEEVVKDFPDPRIRYIRLEENRGAAAARNIGIKAAKGEYIAFQDSDDEWLPEKLEKQIEVFKIVSKEVGVVYADAWRISSGRRTYLKLLKVRPENGFWFNKAFNNPLHIGLQSTLIRKECFQKAGLLDERFPRLIDYEFLVRVSKYFLFYHIDEPLVNYYYTPGAITTDVKALIKALELLLEKYYENIRKDRKLLARYLFSIGSPLCQIGEMKRGREYLLRAVRTHPFDIKYLLGLLLSISGNKVYAKLIGLKKIILAYSVFSLARNVVRLECKEMGRIEHDEDNKSKIQ